MVLVIIAEKSGTKKKTFYSICNRLRDTNYPGF